jgi:hypothetical protein
MVDETIALADVQGPVAGLLSLALDLTVDAALTMIAPPLGTGIRALRVADDPATRVVDLLDTGHTRFTHLRRQR